jgi:caffeoyl-CoA O-methyltransferase
MRGLPLTDELLDYVRAHSVGPDAVGASLIATTATLGGPSMMQITPEQGALLGMLVRLIAPRAVVEVGTFTGYSALVMARAMPDDASMICCDLSVVWTDIAVAHWEAAGVADRIDLRLGFAIETLRMLPLGEWIDFAFIDADKGNYVNYYEELVCRLRPGGVVVADNVLGGGLVAATPEPGSVAASMHQFNCHAEGDPRTETVLLPIADGMSIIRKI